MTGWNLGFLTKNMPWQQLFLMWMTSFSTILHLKISWLTWDYLKWKPTTTLQSHSDLKQLKWMVSAEKMTLFWCTMPWKWQSHNRGTVMIFLLFFLSPNIQIGWEMWQEFKIVNRPKNTAVTCSLYLLYPPNVTGSGLSLILMKYQIPSIQPTKS